MATIDQQFTVKEVNALFNLKVGYILFMKASSLLGASNFDNLGHN